jgi:hypothetical protein
MGTVVAMKLNLTARDTTGQRRYALSDVRGDATVRELVRGLVRKLGLSPEESALAPQFHAFLERDGRHLRSSEIVGEALREGDEVVLQPDVQAGGGFGS